MNKINNFNEFMKVYGISLILLSKLKSIRKLLNQNNSNQLHPVFQLI